MFLPKNTKLYRHYAFFRDTRVMGLILLVRLLVITAISLHQNSIEAMSWKDI